MLNHFARLLSAPLLGLLLVNNASAESYDNCQKWVTNSLGVHCKSAQGQDIGTLLFFKKINDIEWHYQSTNQQYPFELILNGPGLLGGTVTEYGRDACNEFCDQFTEESQ